MPKCIVCNKEFEAKRSDAQICSPKCRQQAARKGIRLRGNNDTSNKIIMRKPEIETQNADTALPVELGEVPPSNRDMRQAKKTVKEIPFPENWGVIGKADKLKWLKSNRK